jgi:hypothetical protein
MCTAYKMSVKSIVLHCTVLHFTSLHHVYCSALHFTAPCVLCCTALHCVCCALLYCTAYYTLTHCVSTSLYYTLLYCYCTLLYCIVLFVLHCTALHCTALHCSVVYLFTPQSYSFSPIILFRFQRRLRIFTICGKRTGGMCLETTISVRHFTELVKTVS